MCEHQWEPNTRVHAGYRCARCFALGYRGIKIPGDIVDHSAIIPLLCDHRKRGPDGKRQPCGQPAVVRKPQQRCPTHRKK